MFQQIAKIWREICHRKEEIEPTNLQNQKQNRYSIKKKMLHDYGAMKIKVLTDQ